MVLLSLSAGELTTEELERIVTIIQNPTQYKIPSWFLNRQRDIVDGKDSQILANALDNKLREDLERLKKIRAHRGLRHYWGLRVRGQHTKTTGKLPGYSFPLMNGSSDGIFLYRSSRSYRRCIEEEGLNVSLFFFLLAWGGQQYHQHMFGGTVWKQNKRVHKSKILLNTTMSFLKMLNTKKRDSKSSAEFPHFCCLDLQFFLSFKYEYCGRDWSVKQKPTKWTTCNQIWDSGIAKTQGGKQRSRV